MRSRGLQDGALVRAFPKRQPLSPSPVLHKPQPLRGTPAPCAGIALPPSPLSKLAHQCPLGVLRWMCSTRTWIAILATPEPAASLLVWKPDVRAVRGHRAACGLLWPHTLMSPRLSALPPEALYIPEGWFHAVASDPATLAVNFWGEGLRRKLVEHAPDSTWYYARCIMHDLLKRDADAARNAVMAAAVRKVCDTGWDHCCCAGSHGMCAHWGLGVALVRG